MRQISIPLLIAIALFALGVFLFHQADTKSFQSRNEIQTGQVDERSSPDDPVSVSEIQKAEKHQTRIAERKRKAADWESVEQLLLPLTGKNDLHVDLMLAEAQANLGRLATETLFELERRVASDRSLDLVFQLARTFEVFGNLTKARGILVQLQKAKAAPSFLLDVSMRLGEVLMLLGKYDTAEECFQKAVEINPGYAEAFVQIFKLRIRNKEAGNLAVLRVLGDHRHKGHFAYNLRLGQLLLQLGFSHEARDSFRLVLTLKPDYFPARLLLYQALNRTRETAAAIKELENIYRTGKPFPPNVSEGKIYAEAAQHCRAAGRPDLCLLFFSHSILCFRPLLGEDDRGMLSFLQSYVDEKGTPDEKNFWLGFTTFVGGDSNRTKQIIEPLISAMTNKSVQAEARHLVAECDLALKNESDYYQFVAITKAGSASKSGQLEKAEAENWARAASGPYSTTAMHKKQAADLQQFRLGNADPDADALAAPIREFALNHPNTNDELYRAGVILAGIGDFAGSISCFEKILKQEPNNSWSRMALARVLQESNNETSAMNELALGIEIQPDHLGLRTAYAIALLKSGDLFQGLIESRHALLMGSDAPLLHLARGECFLSLGRIAEARREIEFAIAEKNLAPDLLGYLEMVRTQLEASAPSKE